MGKPQPRGEQAGSLPVCLGDTWRMTFCILLNQLPSFGPCHRQHPEPLESALVTVDQPLQELSRHQTNMNPKDRNCRTETQNRARQHLPPIYLFLTRSKCERLSRSQNESLSLTLAPTKWGNKSNYINAHFNKADTKALWTVGQSTI